MTAGETALLDGIRKDPRAAFPALIQANNRRLFRIARGILRDDSEAEEAVQETYARAFANLDSFRGESSLGTWLARILINEAVKRQQRREATEELAVIEEMATLAAARAGLGPAQPDPENSAARQEIRRLVELAIDRLPPVFRVVFVMRVIEQMSVQETAAALAISPQTVKTRLHRATRRLRGELGAELSSIFEDIFPFAGRRCEQFTRAVLARIPFLASPGDRPVT